MTIPLNNTADSSVFDNLQKQAYEQALKGNTLHEKKKHLLQSLEANRRLENISEQRVSLGLAVFYSLIWVVSVWIEFGLLNQIYYHIFGSLSLLPTVFTLLITLLIGRNMIFFHEYLAEFEFDKHKALHPTIEQQYLRTQFYKQGKSKAFAFALLAIALTIFIASITIATYNNNGSSIEWYDPIRFFPSYATLIECFCSMFVPYTILRISLHYVIMSESRATIRVTEQRNEADYLCYTYHQRAIAIASDATFPQEVHIAINRYLHNVTTHETIDGGTVSVELV